MASVADAIPCRPDCPRFFADLEASRQQQLHSAAHQADLVICKRRIRLTFADASIAELLTSSFWSIERASAAAPDANIFVWGNRAPLGDMHSPWSSSDIGPRGEIRGFNEDRYSTAYNLDAHTLSAYDSTKRSGHYWARSLETLPNYERAAPLRTLIAWAVREWSAESLHVGAVAGPRGAVLLVGAGGSGKSSAALSAAGSLQFLGDDNCIVQLPPGKPPVVWGVYNTAKLELNHLRRFLPDLTALAQEPPRPQDNKVILRFPSVAGSARCAPVVGLVLPTRIEGTAGVSPCSKAMLLRALAPSSIFQTSGLGASSFSFCAQLVRHTRCYTVNAPGSAAVLCELLESLVGGAR